MKYAISFFEYEVITFLTDYVTGVSIALPVTKYTLFPCLAEYSNIISIYLTDMSQTPVLVFP